MCSNWLGRQLHARVSEGFLITSKCGDQSFLPQSVLQLPFLWQHVFLVPSAAGWRKKTLLASFSGGRRGVPFLQRETGVWDLVPRKVIKNEWLSSSCVETQLVNSDVTFSAGICMEAWHTGRESAACNVFEQSRAQPVLFLTRAVWRGRRWFLTVCALKQFLAMGWKDAGVLVQR